MAKKNNPQADPKNINKVNNSKVSPDIINKVNSLQQFLETSFIQIETYREQLKNEEISPIEYRELYEGVLLEFNNQIQEVAHLIENDPKISKDPAVKDLVNAILNERDILDSDNNKSNEIKENTLHKIEFGPETKPSPH